jgi:hypothetical protein
LVLLAQLVLLEYRPPGLVVSLVQLVLQVLGWPPGPDLQLAPGQVADFVGCS